MYKVSLSFSWEKECQDRKKEKWRWGRELKREGREEEGRKRERGEEEKGGDLVTSLPDNQTLPKTSTENTKSLAQTSEVE